MQLLCYDGTHKETKWLAVKSKGAIQVFRMFRLDRRLPKDYLGKRGSLLYEDCGGKPCEGGVTSLMVISGGGYGVLAGNWLPLGYNPGGTLGIDPSGYQGAERGQGLTDGWMIVDRTVIRW